MEDEMSNKGTLSKQGYFNTLLNMNLNIHILMMMVVAITNHRQILNALIIIPTID